MRKARVRRRVSGTAEEAAPVTRMSEIGLRLPDTPNSVEAGHRMKLDLVGSYAVLIVEEVPEADAGDRGAAVEAPAAARWAAAGLLEVVTCARKRRAAERADSAAQAR